MQYCPLCEMKPISSVCHACGEGYCWDCTTQVGHWYICRKHRFWTFPIVIPQQPGHVYYGMEIEMEKGYYPDVIAAFLRDGEERLPHTYGLQKVGTDSGLLFGGLELATQPYTFRNFPYGKLEKALAICQRNGFHIPLKSRCAMHVNVSRPEGFDLNTYLKLIPMVEDFLAPLAEDQRIKLFSLRRLGGIRRRCLLEVARRARDNCRSYTRYFVLNLQAYFERQCIEVRCFKSTLQIDEIKRNMRIARAIIEHASEIVQYKPKTLAGLFAVIPKRRLLESDREYWQHTVSTYPPAYLTEFDFGTWSVSQRWGDGTQ